jgi:hypothetical protein
VKNYFHVLGLPSGASADEIRRAYRTLVKQYHPDLNKATYAAEKFIAIHEAYEFLMDERRRLLHAHAAEKQRSEQAEQERRDRVYKIWVEYQQDIARERARSYANRSFSDLENSHYYRAFRKVNRFTNITVILLFIVIVAIPIWRYMAQQELPEHEQRAGVFFAVPAITGLICLAGGYYYLFVLNVDET